MTIRSEVAKRTAAELAPELEARMDNWLSSDMIPGSREHTALSHLLWDNKAGILHVLQQVGAVGETAQNEGDNR